MRVLIIVFFISLFGFSKENNPKALYNESHRPQFHFTYKKGWLGDINGLVYYKGEYHFFSQHCSDGPDLSYPNVFWGHAISTDWASNRIENV